MSRFGKIAVLLVLLVLLHPRGVEAVETAPPLSDREIIERLTAVETKVDAHATALAQLRQDMNAQFGRIDEQFGRIDKQFGRIDAQFGRIDEQFGRLFQLMLGILGAFTALMAATIGFALWDRRTMIRPFESKVKTMEDELARDRESLHSLLEAFRSLGKGDERVANVLRQFRLL